MGTHLELKPLSTPWMQRIFNCTYLFTCRLMRFSCAREFFGRLTPYLISFLDQRDVCIRSRRGTRFYLKYPEDIGWESLIIHKDYELGTSDFIESFLKEGFVVFDIGANIGWYTILAAKCVGSSGKVHGFEPLPKIFQKLEHNVELNFSFNEAVRLHNVAITSGRSKEIELFSYDGLSHGLTSAKALYGNTDSVTKVSVQTKTLDEIWIKTLCYGRVDLIKVDVEGLEYDVVEGAQKLIKEVCPLWLLEINYQTSRAFQWTPEQLMKFFEKLNHYRFIKIHEAWGGLSEIRHSDEIKNGDILVAFNPDKHKIFKKNWLW